MIRLDNCLGVFSVSTTYWDPCTILHWRQSSNHVSQHAMKPRLNATQVAAGLAVPWSLTSHLMTFKSSLLRLCVKYFT